MAEPTECFSCRQQARFDELGPRERIAADAHWVVSHSIDTSVPGWLVLVPRRHVTAIADLSDQEAATLGVWQVRLSRALHTVTGCVKTYIAQFGEAEGFAHVHFHIVPRSPLLPSQFHGPRIFPAALRQHPDDRVSTAEMDRVSTRLSKVLAGDS
ncbi:HIT family protein [Yinghuangia seranimata]|uniref:HIT family protein n=1 Tax=Yinghuangia seranimata TaxID=408067 RepID=UPI00248AAC93|nr:HIT family protein [Yinghuangia seranimata]MDI2127623.1 HIT family protein [Yinghuangia seranimata]